MKIDPQISEYIDIAIERERKIFDANAKHNIALQHEIFLEDVKKIAELVKDRPSRSEVREIVRDELSSELRPIKAEMLMYKEELLDHRSRIETLEANRF